jgi:group I intron endonuclease
MTKGYIYAVTCSANGKVYVGKTVNPAQRFANHRWALKRTERMKDTNRHMWNAAQKHGIDTFEFRVLEEFDFDAESIASERELWWMDELMSCDRRYGFNLRRDSATKMVTSDETRALMSKSNSGYRNPNHGNKWTSEMKQSMSADAKLRHAAGRYGPEWKRKIGKSSSKVWEDDTKRSEMAAKVSLSKRRYRFHKCDENDNVIETFESVRDIVEKYSSYKWQNIYSVCDGHKKRIYGFKWRKELL